MCTLSGRDAERDKRSKVEKKNEKSKHLSQLYNSVDEWLAGIKAIYFRKKLIHSPLNS
jgi:hypothetical protein